MSWHLYLRIGHVISQEHRHELIPTFDDHGGFGFCNGCRVFDEETGDAAVVDPVWPDQVLQAAQINGAKVKMVLTTHHHW